MLSESLRVPYRADDAFGTLLVGSVLTVSTVMLVAVWTVVLVAAPPIGLAATPVVVLPALIMRGYLLAVVDSGIHEEAAVPSFVHWGTLVRAGSKSTLLSAIYLLPAAVLGGLAVGGWIAAAVDPPGYTEAAQALTGVLILVAGFGLLLYGLVYLYVRPAARAVLASTGSLRAAVRLRRVVQLASTSEYLTGWLIVMGLLTGGPTVLLPLVGVAVAVSYLSPVAALLVLLVTALLGFGLGFVLRVSAAWATGRGAATGVRMRYPASMSGPPDERGVMVTDEPTPASQPHQEPQSAAGARRPEADPSVQTGRTVGQQPADTQPDASDAAESEAQSPAPAATEPTPGPAEADGNRSVAVNEAEETVHGGSPAADTAEGDDPVDSEIPAAGEIESTDDQAKPDDNESVDPDDNESVDPDDNESVDPDGDHGFVWGVDDEP